MAGANGKGNGTGANGSNGSNGSDNYWDDPPDFDDGDEPAPAGHRANGKANGHQDWDHTPLEPVSPVELEGRPVPIRRWVVPQWIPWGRVTGLYGHGGEGKTLLCQQLMTACALGQPWIGLSVTPMKVVGFFCEDDTDEMHQRQDDINQLYNCSFRDLGNMLWLPRLGLNNILMDFPKDTGRIAPLVHEIIELATGFGAELVIVDTVSDTFDGDENNRPQVRRFVQTCLGGIARAINGTVLATAHPSRTGLRDLSGDGGSTQWHNTFRARNNLISPPRDGDQPDNPNIRILKRMKANYAPRDAEIELTWKAGTFQPTNQPTGLFAAIDKRKAERVFLDLLDATTTENQPVCATPRAGNYAPALFAKRPLEHREGYKKSDLEHAMQALFASHQITNQPYGYSSRPLSRIVRSG